MVNIEAKAHIKATTLSFLEDALQMSLLQVQTSSLSPHFAESID